MSYKNFMPTKLNVDDDTVMVNMKERDVQTSDEEFCDCIRFVLVFHFNLYAWLEILKLVFSCESLGWRVSRL